MASDSKISWFVALLVVFFGSGSWISVSGIWVEMPFLILGGLPEKYEINAYISIVIQLALVGTVAFLIFNRFAPKRIYRPEIPVIYVATLVATIGTLLVAFTWDSYTVWSVDGKHHSTAFLVLLFFIAMVDVVSNVAFVGFMSILKSNYLNWYWIGQGGSALLPAIVVLIQKEVIGHSFCVSNSTLTNETTSGNSSVINNCVLRNIHFGPTEVFFVLSAMMFMCFLSFIALNTLPIARREYEPRPDGRHLIHDPCGGLCNGHSDDREDELPLHMSSLAADITLTAGDEQPVTTSDKEADLIPLTKGQYVFLYTTLFWDYLVAFGVMAPIQSFSGSAYGEDTFEYVVIFREIAKVASYFLFLLKPVYSFAVVIGSFVVGTLCAAYCLTVAVMSPHPPFEGLLTGKILIVLIWICEGLFLTYCKASTLWIVRKGTNSRTHLIWTGFVGQIGVVTGTVIMFPLISVYKLFEAIERSHCNGVGMCDEL